MNQFLWDQQVDFPFAFAFRAELEARAQGNVSWNTGVDYRRQLEHSIGRDQVRALYEAAGLDLGADLKLLNETVRISADPEAVHYLERNIIFDGEIHIPVLTLHTRAMAWWWCRMKAPTRKLSMKRAMVSSCAARSSIVPDTVRSHQRKPSPPFRRSSTAWIREDGKTSMPLT